MATYDKGDQVRVKATFTDTAGVAADPTNIVCRIKNPQGVTTAYTYGTNGEVVKESTGVYHLDLTIDQSGQWFHRWEGTGALVTAGESRLFVQPTQF